MLQEFCIYVGLALVGFLCLLAVVPQRTRSS